MDTKINEVIEKINTYEVVSKKNIDVSTLYNNAYTKFKNIVNTLSNIDESSYEDIKSNIRERKKFWVFREIANEKSKFNKRLEIARSTFELNSDTIINNCSNIDDLRNVLENDLYSWRNSDSLLISYPYIESKHKKTIIDAIEVDLLYALLVSYVNQYKETEKLNQFEVMPNSLNVVPIDTSNRLKMAKEKENYVYQFENDSTRYIYRINVNDVKNLSISSEIQKIISTIKKVLNKTDIKVFNYLLKNRDVNFFDNGIIRCYLDEMSQELFGYKSKQYYNTIKGSLYKMSIIKGEGASEGKSSVLTSLIGDVLFDEQDNGRIQITTVVGLTYRNDIIQGNITKVYSKVLEKLEDNEDAYLIIFFLQKRRLKLFYNKDKNMIDQDLYTERRISYTDIASVCMINDKKKSRVIKRIRDVLAQIAEEGSILIDFSNKGDFFDLSYQPVTEEEIKDLERRLDIKE